MKPNVHDPEYWLEELKPLLVELDFAFKLSVPKAHAFFTEYVKKVVNRPLLSNLTRFFALDYLWSRGFSAKEEIQEDEWGLNSLPNNGIEVLYRQSCVRIRKGLEPPYPMTESAREFCQQRLFEHPGGIVTNLFVLYSLTEKLEYAGLRLVRPLPSRSKKRKVRYEWLKSVNLPTLNLDSVVTPNYSMPVELNLDPSTKSQRDSSGADGRDREIGGTGTEDAH